MTATDIQDCQYPNGSWLPHATTTGASAMSGHGLRDDDPRQQAALEPVRPQHEHRQRQPDEDAGEEPDERLTEREQRRVDEVLPERDRVSGALWLAEPPQDVHERGQRRVVGRHRAAALDVPGQTPPVAVPMAL